MANYGYPARFFIIAVITLLYAFLCNSCFGNFQKETKTGDGKEAPGMIKPHDDARQIVAIATGQEIVSLPIPSKKGTISVEEALWERKSVRRFKEMKLDLVNVGQLLWAAQGENRPGRHLRTCPSAGATYPLIAYAVLPDGIFQYIPDGHKMKKVIEGDRRHALSDAALGQRCISQAPLNIVLTAKYGRTTRHYGERGKMYVHIEVGHAAQNVHLQAVALGLASVPIGAFHDEEVSMVMQLKKDEVPLYIIPVGYAGE